MNAPRGHLGTQRARIVLSAVLGSAALLTGVMAFAHTRAGRPLLGWMSGTGSDGGACPFGQGAPKDPVAREAGRRAFAATHGGPTPAAARPALGFRLDATTLDDIRTWAQAHGIRCKDGVASADLECEAIPASALPAPGASAGLDVDTLWLTFGRNGELVGLIALRRDPDVKKVSAAFEETVSLLSSSAGAPHEVRGARGEEGLSLGPLAQASAEYRFRDYFAVARATNMGDGFMLSEEYRALPSAL